MLLENFQITEAAHYRLMNSSAKIKKSNRDKESAKKDAGKVKHINRAIIRMF